MSPYCFSYIYILHSIFNMSSCRKPKLSEFAIFLKTRYNGPRYIYRVITHRVILPLFKIFNAISFTCFHIRKQMPHPPSFGMGHQSVYLVYSYNTQTFHKSWHQQVYVGRMIELQLIYCIYFIQIPMYNDQFC